jgi:hypothetical protein
MSDSSGVRVLLFPRSPELWRFPPSSKRATYLDLWDPPISDLILHQWGGQYKRGKGVKGRGEQKKDTIFRSFALNLSGSGNPEYAIHRVVEPEIDHIES